MIEMKFLILSLAVFISTGVEGGSLFKETFAESRQDLPCCQDDNLLSCHQVDLDAASLGDEDLDLTPLNTTVQFQGLVEGSKNSYHYENDLVDMVLTVHNGDIYGHMSMDNGDSYVIEYCGNGMHVIKQLDVDNLGENVGVDTEDLLDEYSFARALTPEERQDTSTIVTYTIKVYYTEQFAAVTSDIDGFIEQVIQETNQGYVNSKIPLRARVVSTEQASIDEVTSSNTMLNSFRSMKSSQDALRGSADAAALLVASMSGCGIAYTNTIANRYTISVSKKSCALGYYSFGHELGHNMGLQHNPEQKANKYYSYGHGHLITKGSHYTGFRTILSYSADGHRTRVNYYSNPEVNYPITGTPTGIAGLSNNARVLTENRFAMAAVGDESEFDRCVKSNVKQTLKYFSPSWISGGSQDACKNYCLAFTNCVQWRYQFDTKQCAVRYNWITNTGTESIPDLSKEECKLGNACIKENSCAIGHKTIDKFQTQWASACHSKCVSTTDCIFWKHTNGYCYLYATKFNDALGHLTTSGFKVC